MVSCARLIGGGLMKFISGFSCKIGKARGRRLLAGSALLAAGSLALLTWPARSSGEASPAQLYVIGAGAKAEPMPVPVYTRFLTKALGTANDSLAPVLAKRGTPQAQSNWGLNSIGVGLGVSGQIGIGPLFNITITPQLRLVFSDSKNPVYPN
jgi:hypothetical protein